jgi:PAS domain S-box-containing protein
MILMITEVLPPGPAQQPVAPERRLLASRWRWAAGSDTLQRNGFGYELEMPGPDRDSSSSTPALPMQSGIGRRLYLGAVMAAGAVVFGWSLVEVLSMPPGALLPVLAALTAVSSAAAFRMPGFPVSFSLADTFTILAALMFGPAAGTLLVALDGLVLSLRFRISKPTVERVVFNTTSVALAMWLSAHLFFSISGLVPLTIVSASPARTVGSLAAFATAYFFLNTGLVAGAVAIGREASFYHVWREHFSPLWVTHFGGTSIAALLLSLIAAGLADVSTLTVGLPLIMLLALLLTGAERLRQRSAQVAELRSYAAALRSTADAVLLTNVKDEVTFLNPRAERLTGWTEAQARGRNVGEILQLEPISSSHADRSASGESSEERLNGEYILVRQDGSRCPIEQSYAYIRDTDQEVEGVIRTFRDISQRKAVEAERQTLLRRQEEARAAADAANRAKDEFLATLSHELRTPMSAILGWVQLLKSGRMDNARTEQALASLERGARAQAVVVNDLLDTSRIMRGNLRLDIRRMELAPILNEAAETVLSAAQAKRIELVLDVAPDLSTIDGDPDRLRQVFWNLLSNSVKFTPSGGSITVLARRERDVLRVLVSDTGCGIEPAFLPFVFARFRQGDGSSARSHGGLGLGLAIVRELVELHGGTVEAASAGAGLGAQFLVQLPAVIRRRANDAPHAAAN